MSSVKEKIRFEAYIKMSEIFQDALYEAEIMHFSQIQNGVAMFDLSNKDEYQLIYSFEIDGDKLTEKYCFHYGRTTNILLAALEGIMHKCCEETGSAATRIVFYKWYLKHSEKILEEFKCLSDKYEKAEQEEKIIIKTVEEI